MDEITLVSLIVLGVALLLPVLSEWLAENDRVLQWVKYFIFTVYLIANLYETLLFRAITPDARYALGLFWSYREALSLQGSEGLRLAVTDGELLKEIILNILLYIPLGYLLPFTWPSLATYRKNPVHVAHQSRKQWHLPWKAIGIAFLLSTATELAQLVFHLGLFEFDDIFNNTVGCVVGSALYIGLLRRHVERHGGHISHL